MRALLPLAFGAVVAAGCVRVQDTARERAAADFTCSQHDITITNLGGTLYRADGCGKSATYTCDEPRHRSPSRSAPNEPYRCTPAPPPTP